MKKPLNVFDGKLGGPDERSFLVLRYRSGHNKGQQLQTERIKMPGNRGAHSRGSRS